MTDEILIIEVDDEEELWDEEDEDDDEDEDDAWCDQCHSLLSGDGLETYCANCEQKFTKGLKDG